MRLRDVGVDERDFSALAEATMEEVPTMENPRPIGGAADVLELARACLVSRDGAASKPWPARQLPDITSMPELEPAPRGDS